MQKIILRHQTGSKAHQIDQFDTDRVTEIYFGREPSCTVAFDPHRDDAVSRRHAVIKVVKGDSVSFWLTDLESLNGTKVNGQRITEETELSAESHVQLGNGGPEFIFDFSPRDAADLGATRIATPPTRMARAPTGSAASSAATNLVQSTVMSSGKSGVGRETVMGMLLAERQSVSRKWAYICAGVLAVVAAGGGALYWQMSKVHQAETAAIQESERNTAAQLAQQGQAAEDARQRADELTQKIGLTPDVIVRQFGDSVVRITIRGQLYDHGKPVYQKMFVVNNVHYPAFVRIDEDTIVRWLTYENDKTNLDMRYDKQGSGFVISEDGLIITVKHMAQTTFFRFSDPHSFDGPGYVFNAHQNQKSTDTTVKQGPLLSIVKVQGADKLLAWKASDGAVVFDNKSPTPVTTDRTPLEGHNDAFEVQFPDIRFTSSARFVRASTEADVALIKVDAPQKLMPLQLAPQGTRPDVGSAITVLGYPASSVQTLHVEITSEGGPIKVHDPINLARPTLISGSLARRGERFQQRDSEFITSTAGEVYELNAAASAGSSGSPVFDQQGRVIGLLTYSTERESTTLAVPISYGQVLVR